MYLFYTTKIEGNWAILEEGEARHCSQVLRKKPGEEIHFVDGAGGKYSATLVEVGKKTCRLSIEDKQMDLGDTSASLHLAVAPTKNIDRFEWFLEKATEIGIDRITPLLCQRSERKSLRNDRLERVMVAAMKQSLKARLPTLAPLMPFDTFLATQKEGQRLIAHCVDDDKKLLKDTYSIGKDVCILIGPEGDFSEEEIQGALRTGFVPVSLGNARLRTETAAIVACHSIALLNQ
ncbi:MAG: 16S rRNA (uracil(1498)-N(3))-methyltransferase [Saprospiraceae bacterium]